METETIIELKTAEDLLNLNWLELEIFKSALHEAAHAVIARLTGFEVAWVSLDADFIRNDPLAIQNRSAHGNPLCVTISSVRINPIINKKSALNKDEKETVIGYCMHVLAGPFVEKMIDPVGFNPEQSANDFQQVSVALTLAEPNLAARKKILTLAKRNLKRAVHELWPAICGVANELQRRSHLTGDDVDEFMQLHPVQLAA